MEQNTQNALILATSQLLLDRAAEFVAIEDGVEQSLAAPLAAFVQTVGAAAMSLAANGIGEKAALGLFGDTVAKKLADRPRWPKSRISELRQVYKAAYLGKMGPADEASGVPATLANVSGLQAATAAAREALKPAAVGAPTNGAGAQDNEPKSSVINASFKLSDCAKARAELTDEMVKLSHAWEKQSIGQTARLLESALKLAKKAHRVAYKLAKTATRAAQ